MKYGWLIIIILAARFGSTAIVYPAGDGDLYWQRWLGAGILTSHAVPRTIGPEAFGAPYAPWVPQEWLFGIFAYLGRSGIGWDLFAGFCTVCALGALAIGGLAAERRGASARAVVVCLAFAGEALFESFGVRAQVVAWPMLALTLFFLDIDGPWCYAAIAVAAVWSNWHASAMLAPIVALLLASGSALDERGFGKRTRRLSIVALATLVAICCNPFGWDLPRYALGLFNNPIKQYISEWKVTDIDDTSFALGALPLLLLAAAMGVRSRGDIVRPANDRRWRDWFVLCAFGFLVLSAARNIGIFAIAALPIVAPALSRRVAWFAKVADQPQTQADRTAAFAMPVFAIVLATIVGVKLVAATPPQTAVATATFAALDTMPGEHNIFCQDFAWCSLALGKPNEHIFLDGRADPFPTAVWDDFTKIDRLDRTWRAVVERRHIDTIVVSKGEPLDQALALTHGWHQAYADKNFRLWLRDQPVRVGLRS